MKQFFAAMVAVATLIGSPSAHAQWAVIDAANLQQQMMNVVSTVNQETKQAQQLLNQYQQLKNEYNQLKSLPATAVNDLMGTIQNNIANQSNYLGAVRGLYGDVTNAQQITSTLYARMAASGLSQQDWMAREAERNRVNRDGAGYLTTYQAGVLDQVGQRYKEVQRLQSRIPATAGTHESMQLMNSQMNVLVSTLNQVVEQNAALGQRKAVQDMEAAGREKSRLDGYEAWRKAQTESATKAADSFKSLGGSR